MKVSINFGALADPLDEQLERQGVIVNCEIHQKDADAIARLYVRGLLTEADTTRAWKRLRSILTAYVNAEMKKKKAVA